MEPTVFKREGYMWRLASVYGKFSPKDWRQYTICDYRGAVIWGVVKILAFLAAYGMVIAVPVGDFLAWAVACIVTGGLTQPGEPAVMFMIVVGVVAALAVAVAAVAGIVWLRKKYGKKIEQSSKEPSAIALAYRSWKDKACYLVKFE